MSLEVRDPAKSMHQIVGSAAILVARVGPTRSLKFEAKTDSDTIHEPRARLGVPARNEVNLDSFLMIVVFRLACMPSTKGGLVVK